VHIKIDAEVRRGLRIIEEIPDLSLCKIEGYNGIGKTNAIKLLRLCVGDQPFEADEAAWRTFRSQLVSASIEVTGLRGANKIELQLDPERWPKEAESLGDLLGTVHIDGTSVKPQALRSLLRVYHIMAAETPLSVLASRIEASRRSVTNWSTSQGDRRFENVDVGLQDLQDLINRCLPSQIKQDQAIAHDSAKLADSLTEQLSSLQKRAKRLDRAVDTADRLDQVRGRGAEMDDQLAELQSKLDHIEEKKQALDQQIADASKRQHRDEKAEREFDNAQKYLVRHDKALREARGALDKLTASAGVELTTDRIAAERGSLGSRLNELLDLLPRVNATPMLVALLKGLADRLEDAERHDLGETVLLEANPELSRWTISALRGAFLSQAELLSQRTLSADAERLTSEIDDVRDRLDALTQATGAVQEYTKAQENFAKAEQRLRDAAADLPEQTARTLDQLIETRNELDVEVGSIQANHARLEHARDLLSGGMTEEALAAELVRQCREAGVEVPRVRRSQVSVRGDLDQLRLRHAQAVQQAERAERAMAERVHELGDVVETITTGDEMAWLRRAIPPLADLLPKSIVEQAAALVQIDAWAEQARNRLRTTYSAVGGIGTGLDNLQERIVRPNQPRPEKTVWDRATDAWLTEEVRRWFDSDVVRKSLFNDAAEVRLKPEEMTLTWVSGGETYERPLTAFSSGQQAFAYTRAQISQIDREDLDVPNRLIALDEFGAFLDHDRMQSLVAYLEGRVAMGSHDQVVVILPLEASPPDDASTEEGSRLVKALEGRGYIAKALAS